MDLDETVTSLLNEADNDMQEALRQGPYGPKLREYLETKARLLKSASPELRRFLTMSYELIETQRMAAHLVGMSVGLHLDNALRGQVQTVLEQFSDCQLE